MCQGLQKKDRQLIMPAKSKRSKAAAAKRQKTTGKFDVAVREASSSESEWEESEGDGGLTGASEDESPHVTMQKRFSAYFGKPLEEKDVRKEGDKVIKVRTYIIFILHCFKLFNRRKRKPTDFRCTGETLLQQYGGRTKKLRSVPKVPIHCSTSNL